MARTANSASLKKLRIRSRDLKNFAVATVHLKNQTPKRATLSQLTFFLYAAAAELEGQAASFKEIQEELGETGNSLMTTYKIWLEPNRQFPEAVNWLCQEPDQHDKRRKYLRLTERGAQVIAEVMDMSSGRSRQKKAN